MMDRISVAKRIYAAANIRGRFRLRSGQFSDEYFDKYLFEAQPELLRAIAEHMAVLIPAGVDALAGLEMGGIPVATVLSQVTGIPTLFVRKAAKEYGTCKLAEGGEVAGRRLVIIEDVVTSGGQVIESARSLRDLGASVTDVLCVIDRESGGRANLQQNGLRLQPLFTASELKSRAGE
jgi:orotate phosphoribosyltransferase